MPCTINRTRKRRSSPNSWQNGANDVIMDEDEDSDVMDECAAAMVLMRLSCSPHSPRWEGKQKHCTPGSHLIRSVPPGPAALFIDPLFISSLFRHSVIHSSIYSFHRSIILTTFDS